MECTVSWTGNAGTLSEMGFVAETGSGHILAMEKGKPGEDYIICGPPHTLLEAMALAERITGIKAPRIHAPPAIRRSGGWRQLRECS